MSQNDPYSSKKPLISIILATYNGTRQLDLCLKSIIGTSEKDLEIVIADDGTCKKESIDLVERWKRNSAVRILHAKQEDKGFRLARSRNNAVSISSGEVLLFLDHDIILPPTFITSLRKCMKKDWFASGRRVKLDKETTEELYSGKILATDLFTSRFAFKAFYRRLPGWRYLFPTRNRKPGTKPQPFEGMSGFCIATNRSDFLAVDGFDGAYMSYGAEDWNFLARLINNGTNGGYLPKAATTAHLWHDESLLSKESPDYQKLRNVVRNKTIRPEIGYSKLNANH